MRAPSDFKVQRSMFDVQSSSFSDRLLPLIDGRLGLRTALQIETHEPPANEMAKGRSQMANSAAATTAESTVADAAETGQSSPVLDFIASTEALDRYDEIIAADGWRLDNYRRNPVFQNAHQYGDIIFTLGKALITEVREVGRDVPIAPSAASQRRLALFQRIEFAVDANPMARIAYALYKGKFLNAVSVGFIPIRWEDRDGTEHSVRNADCGARVSLSSSGGEGQGEEAVSFRAPHSQIRTQYSRRYLEQELLEVSAVGIPANPEALQLGLKAGAVARADVKDLLELLRQTLGDAARQKSEVRGQKSESSATREISIIHHPPSIIQSGPPSLIPPFPPAAPNTPASASGVRSNEAQLLELARALRNILRRS